LPETRSGFVWICLKFTLDLSVFAWQFALDFPGNSLWKFSRDIQINLFWINSNSWLGLDPHSVSDQTRHQNPASTREGLVGPEYLVPEMCFVLWFGLDHYHSVSDQKYFRAKTNPILGAKYQGPFRPSSVLRRFR
jgi:hypothetical protein